MSARREGFTIVELLLVMVLGLTLLGAVYQTMIRQEQAYGLFNAMAATHQDTRMGMDLLTAELRELSPEAGDLLMATEDSMRIRALRKFGIVCAMPDKLNKRFTVATVGATQFASGDSIAIYVDQDSLKSTDDTWQQTYLQSVSGSTCGGLLSLAGLGQLLPSATVQQVTVAGAGLRFDSIYPGAPIRSFETLTYRVGQLGDGNYWVQRVQNDTVSPLLGPVTANGFRLAYFDTLGNELTTFPLGAAARASVGRIRVLLEARRRTTAQRGVYTDSLITEVSVRGS